MRHPATPLLLGHCAPGVWTTEHASAGLVELADGLGWHARRIEIGGDKTTALDQIATSLAFPDWVGRNWDALLDALRDLSWLGDDRQPVLLVIEAAADLDTRTGTTLLEVLDDAGEFWTRHGRPFVALWVGSRRDGVPSVEDLDGWLRG